MPQPHASGSLLRKRHLYLTKIYTYRRMINLSSLYIVVGSRGSVYSASNVNHRSKLLEYCLNIPTKKEHFPLALRENNSMAIPARYAFV